MIEKYTDVIEYLEKSPIIQNIKNEGYNFRKASFEEGDGSILDINGDLSVKVANQEVGDLSSMFERPIDSNPEFKDGYLFFYSISHEDCKRLAYGVNKDMYLITCLDITKKYSEEEYLPRILAGIKEISYSMQTKIDVLASADKAQQMLKEKNKINFSRIRCKIDRKLNPEPKAYPKGYDDIAIRVFTLYIGLMYFSYLENNPKF